MEDFTEEFECAAKAEMQAKDQNMVHITTNQQEHREMAALSANWALSWEARQVLISNPFEGLRVGYSGISYAGDKVKGERKGNDG